jgi:hypothetical protein
MKKRPLKKQLTSFEDEYPIVGELRDCRQLSDDHWQGTDVDGTIIDVRGGPMPKYLVVPLRQRRPIRNGWGYSSIGMIRMTRAT